MIRPYVQAIRPYVSTAQERDMQDSLYYKPGGEIPYQNPFSGDVPGPSSPQGFQDPTGMLGGMDWPTGGTGVGDPNQNPDAVDNTAVGRIQIPA